METPKYPGYWQKKLGAGHVNYASLTAIQKIETVSTWNSNLLPDTGLGLPGLLVFCNKAICGLSYAVNYTPNQTLSCREVTEGQFCTCTGKKVNPMP